MYAQSVLLAVLAAASFTTAAPLAARDTTNAGTFSITEFSDGGSPLSIEATISFSVTDATASTPLNNAACSAQMAVQPTIATANLGTACQEAGLVFGLEYAYEGYYLTIAHVYGDNTTSDAGSYYLGADVETYVDPSNPNGNYQYLNHAATFEVAYNRAQ